MLTSPATPQELARVFSHVALLTARRVQVPAVSQREQAGRCGIQYDRYVKLEHGSVVHPRPAEAEALCNSLPQLRLILEGRVQKLREAHARAAEHQRTDPAAEKTLRGGTP